MPLCRRVMIRILTQWILFGFLLFFSSQVWPQDQGQQPGQNQPEKNQTGQSQPSQQQQTPPQNENPPSAPPESQPTQTNPQQPPEDDKNNANPAQAAAQKTVNLTMQAAQTTRDVAQQGLNDLRNWEKGWLTGIYVPKGQPIEPLNSKERLHIYLKETLTSPGAYLKRAFAAGIDQARGAPGQWDDGFGGYMERWASREGQFISANSIAALANAKLGYEPRYDQCDCRGFWPRARHAIWRNFVTYDSSEQHRRPQLGLYVGAFAGGLIASSWKPHPRNLWSDGVVAMSEQGGFGSLLNLFIEFSNDIDRKLGGGPRGSR